MLTLMCNMTPGGLNAISVMLFNDDRHSFPMMTLKCVLTDAGCFSWSSLMRLLGVNEMSYILIK